MIKVVKGKLSRVSSCHHFSGSDDDDDEVPALPCIYPLSRYEDAGVVASMNGLHAQLNGGGGGESAVLKHEVSLLLRDLTSSYLFFT